MTPEAKNELVVRRLGDLLTKITQIDRRSRLIASLRYRVAGLQNTPMADKGMPYVEAIKFLEKEESYDHR